MAKGITVVYSPYHVGLRDHRVGDGPGRLRSLGIIRELENLGVKVHLEEIDPVDDFEGEIGRSFEILRRTSIAVNKAVSRNTFPLVLSGNCMATAGVACGLSNHKDDKKSFSFIYFDSHDDLDSPDVNENGYMDAMGLSMLRGESWKKLMSSVPGFQPLDYGNGQFLYVGLRDQSDVQRQRVIDAGMGSIWGDASRKVDFVRELETQLGQKYYDQALVHLDLDVLDESFGKVNDYPSPGGMFEEDLISCMNLVPRKSSPVSLTVCSFDPNAGDGDKIARTAIRAVTTFVRSLLESGRLDRD